MSKHTKTIQTEYGDATIDVYDCDSCGNTVAYEDTVEFTIGNRDGRACSHCRDEGPLSFPEKVTSWAFEDPDGYSLILEFIFTPLCIPFTVPCLLDEPTSEIGWYEKGYVVGALSTLVWTVATLLLWVIL